MVIATVSRESSSQPSNVRSHRGNGGIRVWSPAKLSATKRLSVKLSKFHEFPCCYNLQRIYTNIIINKLLFCIAGVPWTEGSRVYPNPRHLCIVHGNVEPVHGNVGFVSLAAHHTKRRWIEIFRISMERRRWKALSWIILNCLLERRQYSSDITQIPSKQAPKFSLDIGVVVVVVVVVATVVVHCRNHWAWSKTPMSKGANMHSMHSSPMKLELGLRLAMCSASPPSWGQQDNDA